LFRRVFSTWEGDNARCYNNTFIGGTVLFNDQPGQSYTVRDNLFDQTYILNGSLGTWMVDHNGYISAYARLYPTNATDVILPSSPIYQSTALGDFYLPSGSPLIDAGSRLASAAGLYHYTTQTNQTLDTLTVDIGYHYVAVNANGQPLDTDNDGLPDYLEDANGNGLVDSGETNWQDPADLGFRVYITEPKGQSNLP
jgi:hypothetical protein